MSRVSRHLDHTDLRRPAAGLALATVLAVLLVPTPLAAQAAEPPDSLLSASEAVDRVADEERLGPELRAGTPTRARLSHVLGQDRVVPGSWVVLVEGPDGEPAGIVGIDPETGRFRFATYVEADYDFPEFDAERAASALDRSGRDPDNYALDRARFTFMGGKAKGNFWVVPHASGRFEDYLAVPAFGRVLHENLEVTPLVKLEDGRAYYRLGDGVLTEAEKSIGGEPPSPDPVFSIAPEDEGEKDTGAGGFGSAPRERAGRDRGLESASRPSGGPAAGGDARPRAVAGGSAGTYRSVQSSPATTDTSIAGVVPVYDQGNTNRCGKYALAMIHQWWSPERLGSGDDQVDEIGNYLGGSYGGFHGTNWRWILTPGVKDVMNHWDQVGPGYQDFQTTWAGDTNPIQTGAPSGQSDELKSWIHFLDAPVAVVGDSDGNAPLGHAVDHWVVVTGYDDANRTLHLNNSGASVGTSGGGTRGTVAYSFWNNTFTPHNRSKMVAGYPGDQDHARAGSNQGVSAGIIADSARLEVSPVGLSVHFDGAAGGTDAFGESYESSAILLISRDQGWLESASAGGFDGTTISSNSTRAEFTRDASLSQGGSVGNAHVYLDPARRGQSRGSLGPDSIRVVRVIHDEDDRTHAATTITVDSDGDSGGTLQMPKPVLRPDTLEWHESYRVEDDDPSAPFVRNPDPVGGSITDANWPSGGFPLEANISDASGLSDLTFHYEISALPADTVVVTGSHDPPLHGTGRYSHDIPRSQWYGHEKVSWWVEATDDDADRPGDRSTRKTPRFTFYLPDDDSEGPTLEAFRDEVVVDTPSSGPRRLRYTLEAQLQDSSGVLDNGTYPRIYYRWAPGSQDPAVNDSVHDGTLTMSASGQWYRATMTAPISRQGENLNWRIEARDTDDDRPPAVDRATSWSRILRAQRPGELCVSPDPPDHDFGTVENSGANTTRRWTFTVENCGGERIGVFGGLEATLQKQGGSAPQCPLGTGHCWLSVSGLSAGARGGALRLYGGESETITVNLDTRGHDYQVPALTPGRYETTLRVRRGQSTVRGTLRVGVPDSTGDVPEPDSAGESGLDSLPDRIPEPPRELDVPPWARGPIFVGLEGGFGGTDLGGGGGMIPPDSLNGWMGGLVARYNVSPVLGIQSGVYWVERGGTREDELSSTRVDLTYVDVPLLLTLSVPTGSGIRPRLYAGGSAGFEQSCEVTASYLGDQYFSGECGENPDVPLSFDRPGVDLGIVLGGGLDLGAGPGAFTLSARYRSGQSSLGSLPDSSLEELRNRGLQFTAGYGLSLP